MSISTFPAEHLEHLTKGISTLTIDPYRNALYYFFPSISAFFSHHQELCADKALSGIGRFREGAQFRPSGTSYNAARSACSAFRSSPETAAPFASIQSGLSTA